MADLLGDFGTTQQQEGNSFNNEDFEKVDPFSPETEIPEQDEEVTTTAGYTTAGYTGEEAEEDRYMGGVVPPSDSLLSFDDELTPPASQINRVPDPEPLISLGGSPVHQASAPPKDPSPPPSSFEFEADSSINAAITEPKVLSEAAEPSQPPEGNWFKNVDPRVVGADLDTAMSLLTDSLAPSESEQTTSTFEIVDKPVGSLEAESEQTPPSSGDSGQYFEEVERAAAEEDTGQFDREDYWNGQPQDAGYDDEDFSDESYPDEDFETKEIDESEILPKEHHTDDTLPETEQVTSTTELPPPEPPVDSDIVPVKEASPVPEQAHKATQHVEEVVSKPVSFDRELTFIRDLIYWRDVKKTGAVFGSMMFVLLSLSFFTVLSVLAYLSLAVLTVTLSFRVYKNVLQAVQKTNDGHPFKQCLDADISMPEEKVQQAVQNVLKHVNCTVSELRSLFLIEDLVDSIKLALVLWVLTYVGSWFSGMTLIIIAVVTIFTIPKVYETYKGQIDSYVSLAHSQLNKIMTQIQAKLPFLKKKQKAQ